MHSHLQIFDGWCPNQAVSGSLLYDADHMLALSQFISMHFVHKQFTTFQRIKQVTT
jgi:hypothetical protein